MSDQDTNKKEFSSHCELINEKREDLEQSLEHKLEQSSYQLKWIDINSTVLKEVIILVHKDLELKEAALACAKDEKHHFENWLKAGLISRTSVKEHENWNNENPYFECCIVKPFIFIKEITII